MSRPYFDRTAEFRSAVESAAFRAASSAQGAPLLANGSGGGGSHGGGPQGLKGKTAQRSEFARMAAKIGKDIQATTGKLEKLAQLAKRKTLFDDRPVEISELTYIIKQDIAALNSQIAQLQAFTQSNLNAGAGGKQVSEHNKNVVTMLQTKLADTTIGFKDVLEIRTQNMKASRDRTEQFTYSGASAARNAPASDPNDLPVRSLQVLRSRALPSTTTTNPYPPPHFPSGSTSTHPYAATYATDSPLYRPMSAAGGAAPGGGGAGGMSILDSQGKGKGKATGSDFLALDLGAPSDSHLNAAENGSGGGGNFMQMELAQQQGDDQYLSSRSTAIETIESTVAELGQIFSQLAHMVAVQGEQVTRIDADTEDIAANVSGAQSELLKYYASVSSNRWLMMKASFSCSF
ncbi:cis-Golgi t-SNARE syntaxin [Rhodotorula mucilaginosa]|uniref:Cis-Golgi t-SNARE syntaxin n=1 Tax=Rhodotorula mucilaginosa TaxID=5537 RepID=A0A9P7B8A8_RHOMI|nr:cis-Golgi t-SNARE syntaxin [Rhodotorula mucilaginosa]